MNEACLRVGRSFCTGLNQDKMQVKAVSQDLLYKGLEGVIFAVLQMFRVCFFVLFSCLSGSLLSFKSRFCTERQFLENMLKAMKKLRSMMQF